MGFSELVAMMVAWCNGPEVSIVKAYGKLLILIFFNLKGSISKVF